MFARDRPSGGLSAPFAEKIPTFAVFSHLLVCGIPICSRYLLVKTKSKQSMILSVQNVVKRYDKYTAVDHVSRTFSQ